MGATGEFDVEKQGYINDQWVLGDSMGMGRAGDALARMALESLAGFQLLAWAPGPTAGPHSEHGKV